MKKVVKMKKKKVGMGIKLNFIWFSANAACLSVLEKWGGTWIYKLKEWLEEKYYKYM